MPAHRLDLTGRRFGRLTAREDVGRRRHMRLWRCECDCGAEALVGSHGLVTGRRPCCSWRCPLREKRPRRATGPRGRPWDVAVREEARNLRATGLTLAAIGRRMGVSKQRVHQWLAEG
jgi:hypothetical protein